MEEHRRRARAPMTRDASYWTADETEHATRLPVPAAEVALRRHPQQRTSCDAFPHLAFQIPLALDPSTHRTGGAERPRRPHRRLAGYVELKKRTCTTQCTGVEENYVEATRDHGLCRNGRPRHPRRVGCQSRLGRGQPQISSATHSSDGRSRHPGSHRRACRATRSGWRRSRSGYTGCRSRWMSR
jgi:hypothetical protein